MDVHAFSVTVEEEEAASAIDNLNLDVPPPSLLVGTLKRSTRVAPKRGMPGARGPRTLLASCTRALGSWLRRSPALSSQRTRRPVSSRLFAGASRRLRNAISRSYLLFDPYYPSGDDESLYEIAEACGASNEDLASISGAAVLPSVEE
jgi:hypothetical protein